MKNAFKKYLSVLLTVVMILAAAPVTFAWNPNVDDGKSLRLSTKLFKEVDGEWVEATTVEAGENIKARVYIGTDYYAGAGEIVVFYNNSFFEDDYVANSPMSLTVNKDSESSTAKYKITGNCLKGKGIANMLVREGYISSEFAQTHTALTFGYLYSLNQTCQILDGSHWFAEFDLRVREDAEGTGSFVILPETVLAPGDQEFAYVNIAKGQQGASPNEAYSMYLWQADVSISNASVTVPVTYADYTVETYTMGVDGIYEMTSETIEWQAGKTVTAEYTVEDGFELNEENSVLSGRVAKDGSLVLKVYLDRKTYSVKFSDGENEYTFTYLYGQDISIPDILPKKDGYIFEGWSTDGETVLESLGATDVEGNSFVAVWSCDHKPEIVTNPAACTEDGSEYTRCSVCGEVLGEITVIPSGGHKPGAWETETAPTLTQTGKKVRKCTVCFETVEEAEISKLEVATDATYGVQIEYAPDDYSGDVGASADMPSDKSITDAINNAVGMNSSTVYNVAITVDGAEASVQNKVTVKLPVPEDFEASKIEVYQINGGTVTEINAVYRDGYMVFETSSLGTYAVVEKYDGTMKIRIPSRTTIKYGDAIILHADLSEPLPKGAYIKWTADNGNFSYTVSADGTTCQITPAKKGNTTFTATVYDSSGNEIQSDTQTMTSKAGFFQKLGAFFKKLFGLLKVYPEVFKYIA